MSNKALWYSKYIKRAFSLANGKINKEIQKGKKYAKIYDKIICW